MARKSSQNWNVFVGNIQKCIGSHLQSLKSLGKTKLDDKVIDSLQVYCGKAITENTDSMLNMKDAMMAIWNHCRSTDENFVHHFCPTGEESWCGF